MIKLHGAPGSNYYNMVKTAMLEKGIAFEAVLAPPSQGRPRKSIKAKPRPPVKWSTFSPPQWSSFTPPLTHMPGTA